MRPDAVQYCTRRTTPRRAGSRLAACFNGAAGGVTSSSRAAGLARVGVAGQAPAAASVAAASASHWGSSSLGACASGVTPSAEGSRIGEAVLSAAQRSLSWLSRALRILPAATCVRHRPRSSSVRSSTLSTPSRSSRASTSSTRPELMPAESKKRRSSGSCDPHSLPSTIDMLSRKKCRRGAGRGFSGD